MFVRLTRGGCRPCAASEPVVRAALAAVGGGVVWDEDENDAIIDPVDADRLAGPQLRVFWLNADDPGSADAMAFFTSRRLCRGVPAHFLWRGSQDLHMPDLALDGAEPVALARLLARAGADGGPADLGEPGVMEAKNAGADLDRLRREGDPGSLAVLSAMEKKMVPTYHQQPPQPTATYQQPPPQQPTATATYQQPPPYLHQPQQPYYYPHPQYSVPPPIQRHSQQPRPGAMHFTW